MSSSSEIDRDPLEVLFSQFVQQARRGEAVNIEEFARKYPDQAEEIRELFPTLLALENAGHSQPVLPSSAEFPVVDNVQQLGEYRLLREIGAGGMGIVYEAVQKSTERKVAVKVLPQAFSRDAMRRQRFLQEARTVARLSFRNIVPIYDIGEASDRCYFSMRLIEGAGLDWVIQRLQGNPQPLSSTEVVAHFRSQGIRLADPDEDLDEDSLASEFNSIQKQHASVRANDQWQLRRDSWKQFARIGIQAAKALHHAHESGILHRDIKPGNLLIDEAGTIWITDFGLAKSEKELSLTGPNDVVGTLRYIAPERYEGKLDVRSDLYSLGLTLLELCLQRSAFERSSRSELVRDIMAGNIVSPRKYSPGIPETLEQILLKATAKDPANRYATAKELSQDLKAFCKGDYVSAPVRKTLSKPREEKPAPPGSRRRRITAKFLVGMLVVVCLVQQAVLWNRPQVYTPNVQDMEIRKVLHITLQQRIVSLDDLYNHLLQRDLRTDMEHRSRLAALPRYSSQRSSIMPLQRLYRDALQEATTLDFSPEINALNQRLDLLNQLLQ